MAAPEAYDLLGGGNGRASLAVEDRRNMIGFVSGGAVQKNNRCRTEILGRERVADAGAIGNATVWSPKFKQTGDVGYASAVFDYVDCPPAFTRIFLHALQLLPCRFARYVLKIENGCCHGDVIYQRPVPFANATIINSRCMLCVFDGMVYSCA